MRLIARRDGNERGIIRSLRERGVYVYQLDRPVDLLCIYRGKAEFIEVKGPRGRLTESQIDFIAQAGYHGKFIHVVTSIDEALQIFFADRMTEVDRVHKEGL